MENPHLSPPHSLLVHIDGIDGSGKSTLLSAIPPWALGRGYRVFDAVAWAKKYGHNPHFAHVVAEGDADLLLTSEPTHADIGADIRSRLAHPEIPQDPRQFAALYARDRHAQFEHLVLPFLESATPEEPKIVIQDRGLLTALAYQTLDSEQKQIQPPITIEELLALPGNARVLDRVPNLFVFLCVDAAIAAKRLEGRTGAEYFDQPSFQALLTARYLDPASQKPFASRGTRFETLSSEEPKEIVQCKFLQLLTEALQS